MLSPKRLHWKQREWNDFVTKKAKTAALKESKTGNSTVAPSAKHRERILKAAMALLAKGGRDALTTRAVAEAARVQPPILYRLFHDKAGLLQAVANYGFSVYMVEKRHPVITEDPVESLRAGWRLHIQFGLTNPEIYLLMYADPHPGTKSWAAERSHRMLRDHMQRVAAAGRLRVSEERAAHLFHAAACGIVMTFLGMTGEQRESLSDTACDATLAAIVTDQSILPAPTVAAAATTLRAFVTGVEEAHPSEPKRFTEAERALLVEWLDRLAKTRSLK